MILVLTHRRGFEADHVIDVLRSRGVPFFRFNTDFNIKGTGIDIDLSNSNTSVTLCCDGCSISISQVSVAWFQQPPPEPNCNHALPFILQYKSFQSAYNWVCSQISGFWLNHPSKVYAAANKAYQLKVAMEAGLNIPKTIITNNSYNVRDFFKQYNGQVIVKNLATPWYIDSKGQTVAAYTKPLISGHLQNPEKIEFSPLIYQQFIHRIADVRAVVVGSQIFAAATNIANKSGHYDIRRIPLEKAVYTQISLPAEIYNYLLTVMDRLDLKYSSIDLAVGSDGKYYFLDLNSTGAFIWLEKLANLPISNAIADFLISGLK